MSLELKFEILKKFGSQAEFAMQAREHEGAVSAILRGRRPLTPERAKKWQKLLGCDPELLKPLLRVKG